MGFSQMAGDEPGNEGGAAGTQDPTGTPTDTPPAGDGGGGETKSWRESLPPELRDLKTIQHVPDVVTLVKNYDNAQRNMGADKVVIPGDHASEEDWTEFFAKVGRPESPDKYELEVKGEFDKDFLAAFKEQAHKAGVLPRQAQAMLNWYQEKVGELTSQQDEMTKTELKTRQEQLKQKWGGAYRQNLAAAEEAYNEYLTEDQQEYMKKIGLTTDPTIAEIFQTIAKKTLSEDRLRGSDDKKGFNATMTPDEAQAKINEIYGNPKHPYFTQGHPGHQAAVEEMTRLFDARNARADEAG